MKLLILSDLHLGSPASRFVRYLGDVRALCRQYDRVILNGDSLNRYESAGCEPQAENWLRQIMENCASRDAQPELLSGNHDPAISKKHWEYISETATLIFHGDCIQDYTHPTKREDKLLAKRLAEVWRSMGGRPATFMELADVYREAQYAWLRANPPIKEHKTRLTYLFKIMIPPRKPFDILDYWRRAPGMVARLAKTFDRPLRNVVVGHSHRPGHWKIEGLNIYNTGSCMPISKPFVYEDLDGQVQFGPLEHRLLKRSSLLVAPRQPNAAALE